MRQVRRSGLHARRKDILDVWFDSGVSWAAVVESAIRASAAGPIFISKAATSTAAGFTLRYSLLWQHAGAHLMKVS